MYALYFVDAVLNGKQFKRFLVRVDRTGDGDELEALRLIEVANKEETEEGEPMYPEECELYAMPVEFDGFEFVEV